MTILQALCGYYDRLAATEEVPRPGYSAQPMSFAVILSGSGVVQDIQDMRDSSGKKPRPVYRDLPQPEQRTVQVASNLLWDKTSYVFGVTAADATLSDAKAARALDRTRKEHAAFKTRHEKLLDGTDDDGLGALLRFLQGWNPVAYSTLRYHDEMLDQNVVFRLDGDHFFLHERPAARALIANETGSPDADRRLCLVTGKIGPIARLHPPIKGVRDAQTAGARIVSFNQNSFASYGKEQGDNAPV
jgi:CRISPR-associated protein Csd1